MLVATVVEEKVGTVGDLTLQPPVILPAEDALPKTIIQKRSFIERSDIYRPRFHFTAPKAWINDPCAPIYYKGYYHMFYQYVPNACVWGQPLMWGHAVSKDLLTWMDLYDEQTLSADNKHSKHPPKMQINGNYGVLDRSVYPISLQGSDWYDHCAVFSGSIIPRGLNGRPTLFYTGITQLPIHWTLPYVTGSEVQVLATPCDDLLHHWTKAPEPIILNPPEQLNLVGFRDPFVFQSRHLDSLLRNRFFATSDAEGVPPQPEPENGYHYLILGGGFKGKGGAVFIYRSVDLVKWDYDERYFLLFSSPSEKETESYSYKKFGSNWERPEIFPLRDLKTGDVSPYYMLSFGVEGTSDPHGGLELSIIFKFKESFESRGLQDRLIDVIDVERFDFGNFYASTALDDSGGHFERRLYKFGWVREQILPMKLENGEFKTVKRPHQPFSGVLSLPRDVSIHEIEDVVQPDGSIASCSRVWMDVNCLKGLRERARHAIGSHKERRLLSGSTLQFETLAAHQASILADGTMDLEFDLSLNTRDGRLPLTDAAFTFYIRLHRESGSGTILEEITEVSFDLAAQTVCVDRSKSTLVEEEMHNEYGDFQLYQIKPPNSSVTGDTEDYPLEDMRWRVIWDRSILEIYINNRFCLTTRIYPTLLLGLDNTFMAAQQAITRGPNVDHLDERRTAQLYESPVNECFSDGNLGDSSVNHLANSLESLTASEDARFMDKALRDTPESNLQSIETVLNRRKSIKTKPNKELAFVDIGLSTKKGDLLIKRVDLWTALSTMYDAISI